MVRHWGLRLQQMNLWGRQNPTHHRGYVTVAHQKGSGQPMRTRALPLWPPLGPQCQPQGLAQSRPTVNHPQQGPHRMPPTLCPDLPTVCSNPEGALDSSARWGCRGEMEHREAQEQPWVTQQIRADLYKQVSEAPEPGRIPLDPPPPTTPNRLFLNSLRGPVNHNAA